MRKKSLNFIVPLVVYPFDVMVSFGQSDEEIANSLKKKGWRWDDLLKLKGDGKFIIFPDINAAVIRMKYIPDYEEGKGTLAHEIFHAITYILDRVGMELKIGHSDEAYSYLIGYLTKEIYKKLGSVSV